MSGSTRSGPLGVAMAGAALVAACALASGIAGAGVTGCSSSSGGASPDAGGEAAAPLTTIHLVQNPWDASRLDAAIAQILLVEQLGLSADVTEIDENKQFDALTQGTGHVSFEVWPSGHASDITSYVDTGKVENLGLLGPTGKISWYVPTYLLTTNPALATWQAYKDPQNTAPFATAATGALGQFTAGDPTWTQYDGDIIRNLGLNLKVIPAGSEGQELDELGSVYDKRGFILMYLWTPHAALAKYDLTAVALPPYDPTEYASASAGNVACDYPPDRLFKIGWPGLQAGSPRAYQLVRSLTLTNEEQIQLLGLVDNQGVSIANAARAWIDANQATWQAWIAP
jgi:glycine betaine/proline transport system substrate-binding protein